jgi:glycosyltransferase involved in cell wall biosynthesis/SAM-dependent methyltransferase
VPAQDSQRFSLFHDGAEAGLKAWHAPYAAAFTAGRVADVGCGPGYFLDLLRDRGIAGFGIDVDPAMVAAAKRRGHEAVVGDHRTLASMPDAFTGIHLSHIIEHLWGDEAVELLEGAKTALQPGGMVIVRTPNWGNATVRHGGFWLDHTHKRPYPRELIEKLLTDLGFDTVQAGFEPGGWEDTFVVSRKRAVISKVTMGRATISDFAPVAGVTERPKVAAAPGVRFKIDWRGDFLAQHSFGRCNRELAKAVAATGVVEILPQGEPTARVEQTLGLPVRRAAETSSVLPTFALKHQWPPALLRPQHGYSIHIQPFEFGSVPRSWAEQMPRTVDDVWCPSEYVKKIYTDAGMPEERTFVMPWGVDPAVYHPDVVPTDVGKDSTFVFLFVGGAIWRKGIDILLDAYLAEFTPQDDVALIVKAAGSTTFYGGQDPSERIIELMKRTDVPIVRYSNETFSDQALASLYRRANAFVLPYRGEGFGLPVLEAMATGTPAIVTAGGATDDFVTDRTGYRMPSQRTAIGPLQSGDELAKPGWVLEVEPATLRRYLRHAFEHQDEVREFGQNAADDVRNRFTWAHSAQHVIGRLDELSRRTPVSRTGEYESLNAYEGKRFSQNGEDGIILELFARLRVKDPFFVEFGAETGTECNTALLAQTYDWKGVMIEGGDASFAALRQNYTGFPKVRPVHAMVSRENIAGIFAANDVPKDLDLLSIDVDGNDYYLWEALADYRAGVVIIEINPAYPPPQRWVMAYNPGHVWQHDNYYGASLSSLTALGNRLGYALLGIDNNVVNAFFIRRDLLELSGFPERTPESVFHQPPFRQPHRDGPAVAL